MRCTVGVRNELERMGRDAGILDPDEASLGGETTLAGLEDDVFPRGGPDSWPRRWAVARGDEALTVVRCSRRTTQVVGPRDEPDRRDFAEAAQGARGKDVRRAERTHVGSEEERDGAGAEHEPSRPRKGPQRHEPEGRAGECPR